jgi:hypothetical protein
MKRLALTAISILAGLGLFATAAAVASAGGPSGPAFYIDGVIYRTVGTPTDLSSTDAPLHSFDTIYNFQMPGVLNVASAAPGDQDFNGGRWIVRWIELTDLDGALADDDVDLNDNDVLDSDAEVLAAIDGDYAVDRGIIRMFVCTVNKIPHGS